MNENPAKITWHPVFDPMPYSGILDRMTGESIFDEGIFGEYDTLEDSFTAIDATRKFHVKNGGHPYDMTLVAREHGIFRRLDRDSEGMLFQNWLLNREKALNDTNMQESIIWHISTGSKRPSRVPKNPNPDSLFADYLTPESALAGNEAIRQFVEQTSKRKHRTIIVVSENGVLRYLKKNELDES